MLSLVPSLISRTALLFLLTATGAATAARPAADIILHNGNIITLNDAQPQASALAISGSRIVAIGDDTATDEWRGNHTRTIDLQGKTVIPGLTDTHIHAIRGGQTWTFETYWYDSPSLKDALDKLRADANRRPHDQWVTVVGSWIPAQFAENRAPTVAELNHALPEHPVYIQYLYDYALVNQRGIDVLGLNAAPPPDLAGIRVERDAKGSATGKLFGDIAAFNQLFASISSDADHEGGLRQFFADMNARGVTGIIDPSAGPAAAMSHYLQCETRGIYRCAWGIAFRYSRKRKVMKRSGSATSWPFARRAPMMGNWLFLVWGKAWWPE